MLQNSASAWSALAVAPWNASQFATECSWGSWVPGWGKEKLRKRWNVQKNSAGVAASSLASRRWHDVRFFLNKPFQDFSREQAQTQLQAAWLYSLDSWCTSTNSQKKAYHHIHQMHFKGASVLLPVKDSASPEVDASNISRQDLQKTNVESMETVAHKVQCWLAMTCCADTNQRQHVTPPLQFSFSLLPPWVKAKLKMIGGCGYSLYTILLRSKLRSSHCWDFGFLAEEHPKFQGLQSTTQQHPVSTVNFHILHHYNNTENSKTIS